MELSFKIGSGQRRPTWRGLLATLVVLGIVTCLVFVIILYASGRPTGGENALVTLVFILWAAVPAWVAYRLGRRDPATSQLQERLEQQDEKLDRIIEVLGGATDNTVVFRQRNG